MRATHLQVVAAHRLVQHRLHGLQLLAQAGVQVKGALGVKHRVVNPAPAPPRVLCSLQLRHLGQHHELRVRRGGRRSVPAGDEQFLLPTWATTARPQLVCTCSWPVGTLHAPTLPGVPSFLMLGFANSSFIDSLPKISPSLLLAVDSMSLSPKSASAAGEGNEGSSVEGRVTLGAPRRSRDLACGPARMWSRRERLTGSGQGRERVAAAALARRVPKARHVHRVAAKATHGQPQPLHDVAIK